jgi:taurine dioxygenase
MSLLGIAPMTPYIGAEIDGVDLTKPIDPQTFREIHQALMKHLVIVFRDQPIGPADQVALARQFGTPTIYEGFAAHPEFPDVQVVQNNPARSDINASWHMDTTYKRSPPAVTSLHCVTTPTAGGDTLFSNLYAAYETLPTPLKVMLEQLSATHDYALAHLISIRGGPDGMEKLLHAREKSPPVSHPLVFTHPATGRKSLFVDGSYARSIDGMPWDLGEGLLKLLQKHTQEVEFQVRIRWRPNTLVIFDNRVCQHYASMDFVMAPGEGPIDRRMHRVTVHAHANM